MATRRGSKGGKRAQRSQLRAEGAGHRVRHPAQSEFALWAGYFGEEVLVRSTLTEMDRRHPRLSARWPLVPEPVVEMSYR